VFSPGLGRQERPPNPYHVREFDAAELRDTVGAHLWVEAMLGVVHGARLRAWEAEHGDVVAAQLRTPPEKWPAAVADLVTSVSAGDFDVVDLGPPASLPDTEVPGTPVHDLVVVARKVAG
jgi:hypothetical protein